VPHPQGMSVVTSFIASQATMLQLIIVTSRFAVLSFRRFAILLFYYSAIQLTFV
jgi:hypothetical protein